MIDILWKKRVTNRGGGTKYYVECPEFLRNDDKIQIDTLIRNKKHASILHAVMNEYAGKRKEFVIKIGSFNKRVKDEYNISEVLHKHHIYGFMKFICIFSCYDDIYDKQPKTTDDNNITNTNKSDKSNYKICQGEHVAKNKKDVLIMPFVKDGSIEKHVWTENKIPLLKNLIIQTILSLAVAFERVGFLHRDLHLGNVLFKTTKRENIIFMLGTSEYSIPLYGKKVVITDFESSSVGMENGGIRNYTFWDDLVLFFGNITNGLVSPNGFRIEWESDNILVFVKNARKQHLECKKVIELISPIVNSTFVYHRVVFQKYDADKIEEYHS
jgi:serine/threonine protein kinase